MFDYKQRPWSRTISDEEYARAVGNAPGHPKCRICGSTNLTPDPAGYYEHAQRPDGAPLMCLDGFIGDYLKPDHTTYRADLSPAHRAFLDNTGKWPA